MTMSASLAGVTVILREMISYSHDHKCTKNSNLVPTKQTAINHLAVITYVPLVREMKGFTFGVRVCIRSECIVRGKAGRYDAR